MKYDICYLRADRKAIGTKAGHIVALMPVGHKWTNREKKKPFAIMRGVELTDDEIRDIYDKRKRVDHDGGRGIAPKLKSVPSAEWLSSQPESAALVAPAPKPKKKAKAEAVKA